ncbi:MAG: septum formation initiator family protein [Oscillospiraceae bacterium]|nr:septum formation initiator family protein [Candidatus Ruminococcus equi]
MAFIDRNLAYDLRLFEVPREEKNRNTIKGKKEQKHTSSAQHESAKTEKQNNVVELSPNTTKRVKRRKSNFFKIGVSFVLAFVVIVAVVFIIRGQVQLTELNQQIADAKADLAEKQSIYTQLEMKVDASISTAVVEKYAQENLGMSKASNSQKEFISLSEGDKAELGLSSHNNVFESIADAFSSIWS